MFSSLLLSVVVSAQIDGTLLPPGLVQSAEQKLFFFFFFFTTTSVWTPWGDSACAGISISTPGLS